MRSFFLFISVVALIFVNTIAVASVSVSKYQQKKQIIPSPSSGTHYESSSDGLFYIRVATFRELSNANRYKDYLSTTFHYPVRIRRQGTYQVVFVGPIRKAIEVRSVSQDILASSSKNKSVYINKNISIARHKTRSSINTQTHFKSSSKGPFYIRAGTFKVPNNAYKYKNYLIQKFHQPVVIKIQGIYQVVLVGPIQTEAEMADLSNMIRFSKFKTIPVSIKNSIANSKPVSRPHRETFSVLNNAPKYKEYVIPNSDQPVEIKIQASNQVVLIGPIQSEAQMKDLNDMILTFNDKRKQTENTRTYPFKNSGPNTVPNQQRAYTEERARVSEEKIYYTPVATISIGPDFLNPGNTQTLTLFPPFQNHYTRGNASQTVADLGVFMGVERVFTKKLSMQLGVSGYTDAQITPKGDVWQFALPLFDTISYAYHIRNTRVMATSKLLTTISNYSTFHPYLSGELGASFNQASGYQETPLEAGAVPMTPFSNHNKTSFAWGIGAGVDYFLSQHVRLGIGYQFADLGSASLNPTPIALTSPSLSIPHLYANQLRFQSTFLM